MLVSARAGMIAVSPTDVYYTTTTGGDAQVIRVPAGGGTPALVASGIFFARPVIDGGLVVLARQDSGTQSSILTIPIAGGAPSTVATVPARIASDVVADDGVAYFSDGDGVYAVPLTSTAGSAPLITLTKLNPTTTGATLAGIGLFGDKLIFGLSDGEIESVPLPARPDSEVTMLGNGPGGDLFIMPCDATSCWVGWQPSTLERIDPSGRVLSALAPNFSPWGRVVFDGTSFFFGGNQPSTDGRTGPGFLIRVAVADGAGATLATMPWVGDVAVDDECVYWSTDEGLFSLSKTAAGTFAQ
jgi:hypothetical protein